MGKVNMKGLSASLVTALSAASIFLGSATASAQVARNTPNKPDMDFSECPTEPQGRFQTEFTAPFAQSDGTVKEETYYVSESVMVLMFESEFGFAKDFSDESGYSHPDRFALSLCADDALAMIMEKRKGAAQMMGVEQMLAAQGSALDAKEKELEETKQDLADARALNERRAQTAAQQPAPLQPADPANAIPTQSVGSAPALAASATVQPNSLTQDLASELDAIIARDSRSWLFNRYVRGSVHDIRVANTDATNAEMVGKYRYSGSKVGWIRVRFTDGKVNCLIYHDFPGRCRPVGQNPAGMLALGLVAGAAMSGTSSSGSSSGSNQSRIASCPRRMPDGSIFLADCLD